jgi:hypothetical protein
MDSPEYLELPSQSPVHIRELPSLGASVGVTFVCLFCILIKLEACLWLQSCYIVLS